MTLRIVRDDGLGQDALELIAQSEAELASIYPPEVRFAFSPDELRASGVMFCVAYDGDVAVACGGIAPLHSYWELKRIFVRKDRRRKGVAHAIVAALEFIAREHTASCVRLETGEDSPEAIRFYERTGYRRRGPFGAYQENGSSVFMEKRL